MNRKLPAFSLIALLVVFTSCQKETSIDGNPTTPITPTGHLKWYIEDGSQTPLNYVDSFNVTYDNSNRLTGLVSQQVSFLYSYGSGPYAGVDLYVGGNLQIHETDYLNSAGLIDTSLQYNDTNDTTTEKYVYGPSGPSRLTTYDYTTALVTVYSVDDYHYDGNGDMVMDVQSDGSATVQYITTYTYTTYLNVVPIVPGFVPTRGKHLPATATETDGTGNPVDAVTYTYQFDSQNRLIRETDVSQAGGTLVKKFVYQ